MICETPSPSHLYRWLSISILELQEASWTLTITNLYSIETSGLGRVRKGVVPIGSFATNFDGISEEQRQDITGLVNHASKKTQHHTDLHCQVRKQQYEFECQSPWPATTERRQLIWSWPEVCCSRHCHTCCWIDGDCASFSTTSLCIPIISYHIFNRSGFAITIHLSCSLPSLCYTEYIQQCPLPRSTSCLLQSRSFELDTLFELSGSQSCNGLEQHPKVFEYDCIRHVSGLLFGRNLPFGTSL